MKIWLVAIMVLIASQCFAIDLVIKEVPDDEIVITEIKANAMTTIANHKRSKVPISIEMQAVENEIEAVKTANGIVKPEPIKEVISE